MLNQFINDITAYSDWLLSAIRQHGHPDTHIICYEFSQLAPYLNLSTEIRPVTRRLKNHPIDVFLLEGVGVVITKQYALKLIENFVLKHNDNLLRAQKGLKLKFNRHTKGGSHE